MFVESLKQEQKCGLDQLAAQLKDLVMSDRTDKKELLAEIKHLIEALEDEMEK